MTFKYRYKEPTKTNDGNEKSPLLLLLHGIGADENDLFGLAPFLDERFFIASVQAPFTLPYGGYAWFELILEPNKPMGYNAKQFEQSRQMIFEFIEEIIVQHDLDADRVYLCGFSQGSMMSMSCLLQNPKKFAGVVAMSGRAVTEMIPADRQFRRFQRLPRSRNSRNLRSRSANRKRSRHKRNPFASARKSGIQRISDGTPNLTRKFKDVSNWLRLELDKNISFLLNNFNSHLYKQNL